MAGEYDQRETQNKEQTVNNSNQDNHQPEQQSKITEQNEKRQTNPFLALAAVVGALAVPTVLYFGYDIAKSELSPCESIFEQTSLNLSTKIKFLKTEGELKLGKSQVADLNERAQMTAINMKTCCTVLDQGKLDPEQFLQCKQKTRDYDDRIDELVKLIKANVITGAVPETPPPNAAPATPAATPAAVPATLVTSKQLQSEIAKKVEAARQVSKDFNQKVVQVRKEQALERLEVVPPKNVDVAGQEREPNNDILNTNSVGLDKWITASISKAGDQDYYIFTTPTTHRDWIKIEIQNRSTSFVPNIRLFNAQKANAGGSHTETGGADLSYSFVTGPETKYYLKVSSHWGKNTGLYLLRVAPQKAYDQYEPNQDILKAKKVSIGDELEASIMDRYDVDYFKFENKGEKGKVVLKLENRSLTLRPRISLFNSKKVYLGKRHSETGGADIEYVFEAEAGKRYYFAVLDYYQSAAGDYTVTIERP